MPKIPQIPQPLPIDPSIESAYESSPFDPLAQIRMTGRFLGKIVTYRGKMTLLIFLGSLILGTSLLLIGIFENNPLTAILGSIILLNTFRNFKKLR